jgi:hypothetical protein
MRDRSPTDKGDRALTKEDRHRAIGRYRARISPATSFGGVDEMTLPRTLRVLLVGLVIPLISLVPVQALAATDGDGGTATGLLDPLTTTLLAAGDDAFALTDLTASVTDPGTMHFGPYAAATGDSGTCGPDWATDNTFRYFTIRQIDPTTFRVYEQFRSNGNQDSTFTANVYPAGPSPGACDNSDGTPPGTVNFGVTGSFHGYLLMTIVSADYHPATASCDSPCFFTDDFLSTVFTGYTRSDDAWFFHYLAVDQSLVFHEWRNAACNRGGNQGDIQSTTTTGATYAACP